MDLRDRIAAALKEAMKNRDKVRTSTLRLISAAMRDREIAARGEDVDERLSDQDVLSILGKMVKQRRDSVRAYEEGGRLDLAERERGEIEIIEGFMPRMLTEDEVALAVDKAIASCQAASIRDIGKVMGALKAEYTGRMDFGVVGPMVKNRLT